MALGCLRHAGHSSQESSFGSQSASSTRQPVDWHHLRNLCWPEQKNVTALDFVAWLFRMLVITTLHLVIWIIKICGLFFAKVKKQLIWWWFAYLLVCCDLQKRTQAPLRFTSVLHVVFSIGARCVVIVGSVQKSFTKLILHFLVATILTNGWGLQDVVMGKWSHLSWCLSDACFCL